MNTNERKPTKIQRISPLTGKLNTMELSISEADCQKYLGGGLIQNCFPYLSKSEREFIQSGYTQEDWDTIFGEEE